MNAPRTSPRSYGDLLELAEARHRQEAEAVVTSIPDVPLASDVYASGVITEAIVAGDPSRVEGDIHGHPLAAIVERTLRLAAAGVRPMIDLEDWRLILRCSRRQVEKMRATGELPPPDRSVGKRPLWLPSTVNKFLGERGSLGRGKHQ